MQAYRSQTEDYLLARATSNSILFAYTVDLVPDNLRKLQTLVWDARINWFNLGLELRLKENTLKVIEINCNHKVETCFREMLSEWLRAIDPLPSWEGLLVALKQPPVACKKLAKEIKKKFGIILVAESDDSDSDEGSSNSSLPTAIR